MKTFAEYIEEQNLLIESPNYIKSMTKLPVNIYVSPAQASHGPRIKFQNVNNHINTIKYHKGDK